MPTTNTKKSALQYLGLGLFALSLVLFTVVLGLDGYRFNQEELLSGFTADDESKERIIEVQRTAVEQAAAQAELFDQRYGSTFAAEKAVKNVFRTAQAKVKLYYEENGMPTYVNDQGETVERKPWEVELQDWRFKGENIAGWLGKGSEGTVTANPLLWFLLTFGLAALGGLLYIIPKFGAHAGIKNDHVYHNPLTRGLDLGWRSFFLGATIVGVLVYGFYYMDDKLFWPALSAVIALGIIGLVMYVENSWGRDVRDAGPEGWSAPLGIFAGIYFIGFYVLLYWAPQHVVGWTKMVSPISEGIYQFFSGNDTGGEAGQWFLYGLMYTFIVLVMGVRMISKYRHNKYQIIRTLSVMFFQLSFAFIIPEILLALNSGAHGEAATLPYQDLKNIWPLDYDFFFDWSVDGFLQNPGSLGSFMLFWGIFLVIVGVPLMVHLVGKRWYCSWVCGCGGLAETLGDPWRQLSDKSTRAWKFERYIIHGVLVFAVLMTAGTIYSYLPNGEYWLTRGSFMAVLSVLIVAAMGLAWYGYTKNRFEISRAGILAGTVVGVLILVLNARAGVFGAESYLFGNAGATQKWYGFFIGAAFSGVVGTGFYPLMGNRVWCRFGCPLAAYLGLVQRFQSRFRITTNGSQCISCGNCSTYCEMGIDVRAYAQKGQDIIRASCVGCGVCSAVCPRGVLRLENASEDVNSRAVAERVIHVSEEGITFDA